MKENLIDESLEAIWVYEEKGEHPPCSIPPVKEVLTELSEMGLVYVDGDKVGFTDSGRDRAKNIIRGHRLAERLLTDVLDFDLEAVESPACKFEHILSEGVDDAICTLLGHPKFCPHGLPIPQGECCVSSKDTIESVVSTLDKVSVGGEGRIAYVSTKGRSRLERLMVLGVAPGSTFKLQQKSPSYVIQVGETQIALEEDVAQDIYVQPRRSGMRRDRRRGRK